MPIRNWIELLMEAEEQPASHMSIESATRIVMDAEFMARALADPRIADRFGGMRYLPVEIDRLPLTDESSLVHWHMVRIADEATSEAA